MQPINNRQAGRRRGRNNPRPQGSNGGGGQSRGNHDQGNRIDSRARGNAAQLLEKYRNLAREAQLSGDRVQTEYYLQFADHYFRVLADVQSRRDEQRPRGDDRYDDRNDDDGQNFGFGDDGDLGDLTEADRDDRRDRDRERERNLSQDRSQGQDRGQDRNNGQDRNQSQGDRRPREPREPRDARPERNDRPDRDNRPERDSRPERDARDSRPPRSSRPERAPRNDADVADPQAFGERNTSDDAGEPAARRTVARPRRRAFGDDDAEGSAPPMIDVAVLPPAIGLAPASRDDANRDDSEVEAPRRRLRTKKPVADEGAALDG